MNHLWMRLGDAGEYDDFGQDFDAAALAAYVHGIRHVRYWQEHGFQTRHFTGGNYVSLYWGDDNAQMVCRLSLAERANFNRALKQVANDYPAT
jgi:hypothetical protein